MGSQIRPAERADVPAVWRLINELAVYEKLEGAVIGNDADLEKHIFDDRLCQVTVFEEDGVVVGYTLCAPTYSTFRTQPGLWLEDLYVTPTCRGKGYGKALLNNLIDYCAKSGLGRLEWSVLDWNLPAIGFYEAMGADLLQEWRICRISF
jgi:GNAT superfamily N-acetyltransferase